MCICTCHPQFCLNAMYFETITFSVHTQFSAALENWVLINYINMHYMFCKKMLPLDYCHEEYNVQRHTDFEVQHSDL